MKGTLTFMKGTLTFATKVNVPFAILR